LLATHIQDVSVSTSSSMSGGVIAAYFVVWIAVAVLMIASLWKLYLKAGQPGWPAIIPILNTCMTAHVAGREWWWGLLVLIPCVGIVVWIIILIDLCKAFGKSGAYVLGLIFLPMIFFPILAFGSSQYQLQTAKWL
jgi:hypothetical protein